MVQLSHNVPSGRTLMLLMCILASVPYVQSLANNRNKSPANHLLDMLEKSKTEALGLYGVHDALSARILEAQLPEDKDAALFVSGFGISASRLGQPDAGLLTSTELQDSAKSILQRTSRMPIFVDGDTGFGGAPNIRRTIRDVASLKAAAITIEDQTFPKRCTYVAGKGITVLDRAQAKERIQLALAAQKEAHEQDGNQILVVARTDCRMQLGLEEAVERCLIFEELGADIVYAENLQSQDEYLDLRNQMEECTPMILAQVQTGDPDQTLWNLQEIGDMGYNMGLYGVSGLQATVSALEQVASDMIQSGGIARNTPLASLEKVKSVVGFDELDKFQQAATTGIDDKRIRGSTTTLSYQSTSPKRISVSRLSSPRLSTALRAAASDTAEPDDDQGPQAPVRRTPPAEAAKPAKSEESIAEAKEVDKGEPAETTKSEEEKKVPDNLISNLLDPLADSDLKKEVKSTYDPLKTKFPSSKTSTSASPFAKKGGGSPFAKKGMSSFNAPKTGESPFAKKGATSFNAPKTGESPFAKKGATSFNAPKTGESPFAKKGATSFNTPKTGESPFAKKGATSFNTPKTGESPFAKKGAASFNTPKTGESPFAKKGLSSGPPKKQPANPFAAKKGARKGMTKDTEGKIKDADDGGDDEDKLGSKAPAKSSFAPKSSKSTTSSSPFATKKGISSFTTPKNAPTMKGMESFKPPKESSKNPFFATKKGSPSGFAKAASDDVKKEPSDGDDKEKSEDNTTSVKTSFAPKGFPKKSEAPVSASVSPFSKDGMATLNAPSKKGMVSFTAAKKGFPTPGKDTATPSADVKGSVDEVAEDASKPAEKSEEKETKVDSKPEVESKSVSKETKPDKVESGSPFAGMASFDAVKKGMASFSEVAKKGLASFSEAAEKSVQSLGSPKELSPGDAKGKPMAIDKEASDKPEAGSKDKELPSIDSKADSKSPFSTKPLVPDAKGSASPFAKKGSSSFATPKDSISPFTGVKGGPKGMAMHTSDELKVESKKEEESSKGPTKIPFAAKASDDKGSDSPFAKKGSSSFTAPKDSTSPFASSKSPIKSSFAPKASDEKGSASPFAKKGSSSFSAIKESTSSFASSKASTKSSFAAKASDAKGSVSPFAKKGSSSFTALKESASPFAGAKGVPKGFVKDVSDELKEESKGGDADEPAAKSSFAPKASGDKGSSSPFAKKGISSFTAPKESASPFAGVKKGGPKGFVKDASSELEEESKDGNAAEPAAKSSFAAKDSGDKESASSFAKKGMSSFTAPKAPTSSFAGMKGGPKGLVKDATSDKSKVESESNEETLTVPKGSFTPTASGDKGSVSPFAKKGTSSFTAPKESTSPFAGAKGSPKGFAKDGGEELKDSTASSFSPKATNIDEKVPVNPFTKKGVASPSVGKPGPSSFTTSPFAGMKGSPKGPNKDIDTADDEGPSDEAPAISKVGKAGDEAPASPFAKKGIPSFGATQKGMASFAAPKPFAGMKGSPQGLSKDAEKPTGEEEAAELKAKEIADAAQLAADKEAAELQANEQAESERLSAFIAANKKAVEAARIEEEKKAAETAEADRIAAEKEAAEIKAKQEAQKEAEAARIKAEKEASELKAKELAEAARLGAEKKDAEEAETARIEAVKQAAKEAEAERIKVEKELAELRAKRKAVKIKIVEVEEDESEAKERDILSEIQQLDAMLDETNQDNTTDEGPAEILDVDKEDEKETVESVQAEVIPPDDEKDPQYETDIQVKDKGSPSYSPGRWFDKYGGKTLDQMDAGTAKPAKPGIIAGGNVADKQMDTLRPIDPVDYSNSWFDEKNYRKNAPFGMEQTSFGVDRLKQKSSKEYIQPLQESSAWYADPKQGLGRGYQEASQAAAKQPEPQIEDAVVSEESKSDSEELEQKEDDDVSPSKIDPSLLQPKQSWFDNSGAKGPYMKPSSEKMRPKVDETLLRPTDFTNSWFGNSGVKGPYMEPSSETRRPNVDETVLRPAEFTSSWFGNSGVKGPYMEPSSETRRPNVDETVLRPVDNTDSWYDESKGRSKGAYGDSSYTGPVQKPANTEVTEEENKENKEGVEEPSKIDPRLLEPKSSWFDNSGVKGPYMKPSSGSMKPDVDETVLRPVDTTGSWYDESKGRSKGAYGEYSSRTPDETKKPKREVDDSVLQPIDTTDSWYDESKGRSKGAYGEYSSRTPDETKKPKREVDDSVLKPIETTGSWYDESKGRSKGAYASSTTLPNDSGKQIKQKPTEPKLEPLGQGLLPDPPTKTTPADDADGFHHEAPPSPPTSQDSVSSTEVTEKQEPVNPAPPLEPQPPIQGSDGFYHEESPLPESIQESPLRPFEQGPSWFDESGIRKSRWNQPQNTNTGSVPPPPNRPEQPPAGADDSVLKPLVDVSRWFDERTYRDSSTFRYSTLDNPPPSRPNPANKPPPPRPADETVFMPVETGGNWFDESNFRQTMIGASSYRQPEAPKAESSVFQQAAEQEQLRIQEEAKRDAGLEVERERLQVQKELLEQEKTELARLKQVEEERLRAEEEAKRKAELQAAQEALRAQQELLEQEKAELANLKRLEADRIKAAEEAKRKAEVKAEQERLKAQQELLEKEKAEVARMKKIEEDRIKAAEEAKRSAEVKAEKERLKAEQELLEKEKAELARIKEIEEERLRAEEEAKRSAELEAARELLKTQQAKLEKETAELAELRKAKQEQLEKELPAAEDADPVLETEEAPAAEPETDSPAEAPIQLAEEAAPQAPEFSPMEDAIAPDSSWHDEYKSIQQRMDELGNNMNGEW